MKLVLILLLVSIPIATAQEQKLIPSDMPKWGFGKSGAISDDTAIISSGVTIRSEGQWEAAYVFVLKGSEWKQQQKLTAADRAPNSFGGSIAISGDVAVVGARSDSAGLNINRGAAYIFVRRGDTWVQQQKLVPSDGTYSYSFGEAVAVSGDTIFVGAPHLSTLGKGAVYIYTRSGANWRQRQKLVADDGTSLGMSLAVSGDTAIITDYDANGPPYSAYIYTRQGETWGLQQRLVAAELGPGEAMDRQVALSGDTAIIKGATKNADIKGSNLHFQGMSSLPVIYVYARSGQKWGLQQRLTLDPKLEGDFTLGGIAIDGDTILAGGRKSSLDTDMVCIYTRSGGAWTLQQQRLTPLDEKDRVSFGNWVAIRRNVAIVGAPLQNTAYAYRLGSEGRTQ